MAKSEWYQFLKFFPQITLNIWKINCRTIIKVKTFNFPLSMKMTILPLFYFIKSQHLLPLPFNMFLLLHYCSSLLIILTLLILIVH